MTTRNLLSLLLGLTALTVTQPATTANLELKDPKSCATVFGGTFQWIAPPVNRGDCRVQSNFTVQNGDTVWIHGGFRLSFWGPTLTNHGNIRIVGFADLIIDGNSFVRNRGRIDIDNNGLLKNFGLLSNEDLMFNNGSLENTAGSWFYNSSTVRNDGHVSNEGTFLNYYGGDFENASGGTFDNRGGAYVVASMTNAGFTNRGTLTNLGTAFIHIEAARFVNESGGVLDNTSQGLIENFGSTTTLENKSGGTVQNAQQARIINSDADLDNWGQLTNNGTIRNYGTPVYGPGFFTNYSRGRIDNSATGYIDNAATITNESGAIFVNMGVIYSPCWAAFYDYGGMQGNPRQGCFLPPPFPFPYPPGL